MAWTVMRIEEIKISAEAQRLNDLALAMIVPWAQESEHFFGTVAGFPQFYLARDGSNMPQRMAEILDATKDERLPWLL
jgi:hypothetical protein